MLEAQLLDSRPRGHLCKQEMAKASAGASYTFGAGCMKPKDEHCCSTSGGSAIQVFVADQISIMFTLSFNENLVCSCQKTLAFLAAEQVWDLRSMKPSANKDAAHAASVRDLEFAHQAEYLLASGGDDCRVKVWDLRLSISF